MVQSRIVEVYDNQRTRRTFQLKYKIKERITLINADNVMSCNPPDVVSSVFRNLDDVKWMDYMNETDLRNSPFDYFEVFNQTTKHQALYSGVVCDDDGNQFFKVLRVIRNIELYRFDNMSNVVWYSGSCIKLLSEIISHIFLLNPDYTLLLIAEILNDPNPNVIKSVSVT